MDVERVANCWEICSTALVNVEMFLFISMMEVSVFSNLWSVVGEEEEASASMVVLWEMERSNSKKNYGLGSWRSDTNGCTRCVKENSI